MYVITRVYKVKRREARRAASLAAEIGRLYHEAGQRSEVSVFFNGGTLPGKRNRMYMQWTEETLESPYRAGNPSVPGVRELGAKLREVTTDSWIEYNELLTPDKALEV